MRGLAAELPVVASLVGGECAIYHHTVSLTGRLHQLDVGWAEGGFTADRLQAYSALAADHPLVRHYGDIPQSRLYELVCLSDVVSQREWRNSAIYIESQHPLGCDDQIAFVVTAHWQSFSLVTIGRSGRPFNERERDIAAMVRPHMVAAICRAHRSSDSYPAIQVLPQVHQAVISTPVVSVAAEQARLTPREVSVLRVMHTGAEVGDTARRLGITQATVSTHLASAYRKLGVTSRFQALTMAFPPT